MSKYLSPKNIEEKFDVTLPKIYKDFLENGDNKKYNGLYANIPSFDKPIKIHFLGKGLESFINDDWPEDDPEYGHPYASEVEFSDGLVPLATIGEEEGQFLVLDTSDEECPVSMYEPETAEYVLVNNSFSNFLQLLSKK